jgi:hypothetical protein
MKRKPFYIELMCRSIDPAGCYCEWNDLKLGRPDRCPIYIPVYYAWQEDPDDLHIQVRDGGDNLMPCIHDSGDYIIPFTPWLRRHLGPDFDDGPAVIKDHDFGSVKQDGVLVYHLGWMSNQPEYHEDDGAVAPKSYIEALEEAWGF